MIADIAELAFFFLIPLVIFVVLLVHEMGHYAAARLLGIPVQEVVIGAGRKFWSRKGNNQTTWSFHAVPVWAHVSIAGFSDTVIPLWKRFITVLAGPVFNLALPFLVFFLIFIAVGQPSTPPVLTGVEIGAVADKAGLKVRDRIVAVNGAPVVSYGEIRRLSYDPARDDVYTVERDGKRVEIIIRPELLTFTDVEGINRSYPRLGVIWRHKPRKLEIIDSVNGVDTKDNVDLARELVIRNFDKDVVLGLDSTDGKTHFYNVHLFSASNPYINDPDHEEFEQIFLGEARDDFYHRASLGENWQLAVEASFRMIREIPTIPFQLFPLDVEVLMPGAAVYGDETWIKNTFFKLAHITALVSVLMAFINLLPFPRLDGSFLVFYALELLGGKKPSRLVRARALGVAFLVLYGAILFSNMDNVPGYIDSRLKKLQKLMDNQHTEKDVKRE